MKDYLVKAEAYDKSVRIYVAHTTHLVERARKIHDTWPLVSAAFGRTLTVSLILGALYKDDQTITVRINGGGPIGDIVTKANTKGEVKGYVGNPHVHLESNNGHLAVGAGVGTNGFIYVTKDLGLKNRYVSSSPLQTGEIGEDFSYYFATSEQIPSAVGLGVLVNPDNKIAASGGFVVQVMPGVKEETINKIEEIVKNMPHISTLIKNNKTPEDIVNMLSEGDYQILETLPVKYKCDCNKKRFIKGIKTLGDEEINNIINENKPIEVVCQFCGKKHIIEIEEIKRG